MSKLKSLDELKKIREQANQGTTIRTTGENPDRIVLSIGMATCGIAAGARTVMQAMLDEVNKLSLTDVSVVATGCLGFCYAEPLVEVKIPGQEVIRYKNVDETIARDIVSKHVAKGIFIDNAILERL